MKPKAKNAEYDEDSTWQTEAEWYESTWENEEYEASKGKKGKGKRSKWKGKSKGKSTPRSMTPGPTQSQTPRTDRPQPKSKPEARSCVADGFRFAMMSTKSKPTWRHATWNSADCTVWQMVDCTSKSNCSLCHDAKSMKNFTLHFDNENQCESLQRLWFGEMWFPVEKYVCQVQLSISQDCVLDPAELDLEPGQDEQELCFRDLKFEILSLPF